MRKILLSLLAGTASLAALGSAALAADLPRRQAPPPVPYVAVPVFTWTGFYVGVNAGGAFSVNSNNNDTFGNTTFIGSTPVSGFAAVNTTRNNDRSGFAGGGQAGYNWQAGAWVFGVEADIQGTSFGNNRNDGVFGTSSSGFATLTPTVPAGTVGTGIAPVAGVPAGTAAGNVAFLNNGAFASRRNIDWFATVRGRLGFAWDRLLVYGTGGVAFTDSGNNNSFGTFGATSVPATFYTSAPAAALGTSVIANNGGGTFRSSNSNDVGWAAGAGIEYAFTPNFTGKIEGLYVNLGHSNGGFAGNNVIAVTNTGAAVTSTSVRSRNHDDEFAIVRAGLNYKFNWF